MEIGSLSMKPQFEQMTRKELRDYVRVHRDDLEALDALVNRRSPDAEVIMFHPPKNKEEEQEQLKLFKRIVDEKTRNKTAES
jgi:predicted AAA+ superfamily ATPase